MATDIPYKARVNGRNRYSRVKADFSRLLCVSPFFFSRLVVSSISPQVTNTILFSLVIYFMTNLRRTPGAFFFYLVRGLKTPKIAISDDFSQLISFTMTLTMSMFFRSIASLSRSLSQALAPAAVLILALVMYTVSFKPFRRVPSLTTRQSGLCHSHHVHARLVSLDQLPGPHRLRL